jgi:hypothetical protein
MVHWLKLKEGIEYYNRKYGHWVSSYQRLKQRGQHYWQHLELLTEKRLRREILESFLNAWLCRVDYQSCSSLAAQLQKLPPYYTALQNLRLESVNFQAPVMIIDDRITVGEALESIINFFLDIEEKFGPVAASKLMHMALPDLCVMWDSGIRVCYQIPNYASTNHAFWYVRFLESMQIQLKHVITSLQDTQRTTHSRLIEYLQKLDRRNSLPRMLDKYNFSLRDQGADTCDICPTPRAFK